MTYEQPDQDELQKTKLYSVYIRYFEMTKNDEDYPRLNDWQVKMAEYMRNQFTDERCRMSYLFHLLIDSTPSDRGRKAFVRNGGDPSEIPGIVINVDTELQRLFEAEFGR